MVLQCYFLRLQCYGMKFKRYAMLYVKKNILEQTGHRFKKNNPKSKLAFSGVIYINESIKLLGKRQNKENIYLNQSLQRSVYQNSPLSF